MTRYVAENLRPKQRAWNEATQDRINKVVSLLESIKVIKMLGLTAIAKIQLSRLRQVEIDMSKDLRLVSVLANTSGMSLV
jgi:ATP-binding cassette subfamily C (CFTR/MRP) protein 1